MVFLLMALIGAVQEPACLFGSQCAGQAQVNALERPIVVLPSGGVNGRLAKVHVEGNRALSDRQIKDALRLLREGNDLNLQGKPILENAFAHVGKLLADRGYLRPSFHVEFKLVGAAIPQRYDVVVTIAENRQYRIGDIRIKGGGALAEGAILKAAGMRSGDVFKDSQMRAGMRKLRTAYLNRGFLNFSSNRKHSFDDARGLIHIALDIDEGVLYRIGEIRINDSRLSQGDVRKTLNIRSGDIFNSEDVDKAAERLRKRYGGRGEVTMEVILDRRGAGIVHLQIGLPEDPPLRQGAIGS